MQTDFAPDQSFFYLGDPHRHFQRLRKEEPVSWYAAGRFWCVTRFADLCHVSRSPRLFSSAAGTQIFEIQPRLDGTLSLQEDAPSIIRMDPPAHNRHRKLVIQAFSPRRVQALEARIRALARASLDRVPRGETVNYVAAVAIPMPMLVIAELLGIPAEDIEAFERWSDAMIEAGGGGFSPEVGRALVELNAYFIHHIAERRRAPREDLLSLLLAAEIDGERLTEREILSFCLTLLVAGNETVRNLVAVGTWTLLRHPDQLARLRGDPRAIPNAVEEMLRFVSPVQTFARRATTPCELRDQKIDAGDYVVLLYGSANRDEAVFGSDAECFDIGRRTASRHVAFGFGEHLCMGASLARLEARVLFEELFARLPAFELAGEPRRLPSILMNSLVELPVVFAA